MKNQSLIHASLLSTPPRTVFSIHNSDDNLVLSNHYVLGSELNTSQSIVLLILTTAL